MPAKFITKESWSRCESPSMLYDAVRNPNVSKPALVNKEQDTIDTTRRIKQERLNKLDNRGLELSHESYVTVVQVGKYMFFAVMLPVYLCCYGLPRWFIVKALQPLYEGVKNQATSMGRYAVEMSKQVVDVMKGLLDQLLGDALRLSKQQGKNLFKHILRRFRHVGKKFSNLSKAISKRIKEFKDSTKKHSKNVYEKAEGRVLARNALMKQKAYQRVKQIASWCLKVLKKIDEVFLTPVLKVVSYPFKLLFKGLIAIKDYLLKIFNQVKAYLKKLINPVVALFKKAFAALLEKCKKTLKIIAQPIIKAANIVKLHVKTQLQKIRKALEPVIALLAKVALKIKIAANAGLNYTKKIFKALAMPFGPFLKKIKEKNKDRKEKISKNIQKFKSIVNSFLLFLRPIFGFGKTIVQKIAQAFFKMISSGLQSVKSQIQKVMAIPRNSVKSAINTFKLSALIAARAVFALQIVFTIISMAFTGGFELVKETVEPDLKATD